MTCPFTGEELTLVPALVPDVALLHAQYGDMHGNLRIEGPPVVDLLFARASRKVLATVEKLVSTEGLKELGGANVAYFYVTAVTELEMGAHPTACYPFYAYDRPHTALYYEAAKAGPEAFHERYLAPFVFDCPNHPAYLDRIGGDAARTRLSSWNEGTGAWQRLYAEGVS
jgi:glutaconate CoA-transferase subunit A